MSSASRSVQRASAFLIFVCFWPPIPSSPIVRRAPLLCVEILSREDTVTRLNERISDYFQMGVRYVWVLDPLARRAFCYTPGEMHEVLDGMLRTNDPEIVVPLDEVFDA